MSDREKVIKGLEETEIMLKQAVDRGGEMALMGAFNCLNRVTDVLVMLKEQEPKEVKDKSTRIKFLDEYFEGECPSCRSFIDEHSNRNFCGYCGQAVKWE